MTSPPTSPAPPHHAASPTLPYLGGIDGLRAISVVAVIAYHADIGTVSGGFLGVEVFFAISGYLITSLLVGEHRKTGRISLKSFWARRARRLLPALYFLLTITVVAAVLFGTDATGRLRRDIPAALLYVSNWWQIIGKDSYFAQAGRPPLLRHLWSLAVEEQFYLLWPVVVALVVGRVRRSRFALVTLIVALGSAVAMAAFFKSEVDPSALYYGTFTRMSGLLLGSAFAMVWRPSRLRARAGQSRAGLVVDAIGVVGLAGLVVMFFAANEFDPFVYRGGFVLVDVATVLVIGAVVHPDARLGRVLGIKPLRWIGLRSYGLYLWHWPIFQLTRPSIDVDFGGWRLAALRIALLVVATEFSYRLIERPARDGRLASWWAGRKTMDPTKYFRFRIQLAGAAAIPIAVVALLLWGPSTSAATVLSGEAAAAARTAPLLTAVTASTTSTTIATTTTAVGQTTAVGETTVVPAPTDAPTTAPPETTLLAPVVDPVPTSAPKATLPNTVIAVSAIGDSVMVGATRALERNIPGIYINARTSRQFGEVREVIAGMLTYNTLGHVVLIHLGTNGVVTDGMVDDVMREVGPDRDVYFVTPKVPRPWEGIDNERLRAAPARWPNAHIIDWYTGSVNNPELFVSDATHLTPKGVVAYTQLILNSFN